MSAAIYYHPEAYTTAGPRLMGRNAAGESFLRGFLQYSTAREFWVQVESADHARHFAETVRSFGRGEDVSGVDKKSLGSLKKPGVVYFPGPGIGSHAFQRAAHGHAAWSLCGITHTTSSMRAMDALAELLTAPVQPWDAVICTSTAVKNNVERVLQAQADYLKDRLGITKLVLPQVPVIPLGIHTSDFDYSPEQRAAGRSAIDADENTLVVLFMGRLSFHAKAHPLAMYLALERAQNATGKKVLLVECGWHANNFIRNSYAEAAQYASPSVRVVTLDGRKPADRAVAWSSADVFCSLSDNIQETFGIVPIEAMAARIPVVVADWDGYKDTVRDGLDGFRIPTIMPAGGLGGDLAVRHALEIDNYDMYCGHASSLVAVDVEATAQAFIRLFNSPELRRQLGEAGRQRAVDVYDWSCIIPRYESLWQELQEIRRKSGADMKPLAHSWPARLDPFHAFASYPTFALSQQTLLSLVDNNVSAALQRAHESRKLAMVNYAKEVLPSDDEVAQVFTAAAAGPRPAIELIAGIPPSRQPYVFRSLVWLLKLDLLKVCP